ncbi:MAG: hypothetical protein H5U08_18105 [Thermogutta sp.]|uniref:hypothetical protein n=1 Tax=Thermogutta sp. TaxID=1962930 RepID=UPI001985481E|nr:hypothetical protein [Thermogutta sp.]MBC7354274.1 hypothetical protein [Thermogutta sp.]
MRSQKIPQLKAPRWPVFLSLAAVILFLLTIILITVLLVLITLRITETNKELATLKATIDKLQHNTSNKTEEKSNSEKIMNANNQLIQKFSEHANELAKTLHTIDGKVDELDKRGNERFEHLFSALDKLTRSVQELSDLVLFMSQISAGKRKALIWFVHSKNLQESQYHPGWGELRDRLNRSLFPFDFFCYVQEQGRKQRVYESDSGGQLPAYQTPATNATGRIDWQLLQNAINEVHEVDVVIIICPENQDFKEITRIKVPVHVVLVGEQLLVQVQNLANPQSMYLVPNSPDAVVNTLFEILQKEAAYTVARNNTNQPR